MCVPHCLYCLQLVDVEDQAAPPGYGDGMRIIGLLLNAAFVLWCMWKVWVAGDWSFLGLHKAGSESAVRSMGKCTAPDAAGMRSNVAYSV